MRRLSNILLSTFVAFGLENSDLFSPSHTVYAMEYKFNDLARLNRGLKELTFLIDNFEEKTTYCNFGEFKTDLLEAKNKGALIAAARDSGLLDKGKTMNVMCKRDPEVIRAFLGKTENNLVLQGSDELLKSPGTLDLVDTEKVEEYIDTVEEFSQALSAADSLAYNARQDYDSSNTFALGSSMSLKSGSKYIDQSKDAVIKVRNALSKLIDLLHI